MRGMVNLAQQFSIIFSVLLPMFCYIAAIGSFLFGAWGLWQQSQPHNPWREKPWVPALSILLSGLFASFDTFLTKVNASVGSSVTVSIGSSLTSYSNPTATDSLLGNSPSDALLNIVTLFQGFFQSFGALACLWAVLSWRHAVNGRTNKTWGSCFVQFAFGVALINIHSLTQWLVSVFGVSGTS